MRVLGHRASSRTARSTPSPSGRRRSITATSGSVGMSMASVSATEHAVPATVMLGSEVSSVASPESTTGWSSTRRTLTAVPGGQHHDQGGASPGTGCEVHPAAE